MHKWLNKLGMLRWLWLTLVMIIIDQVSKQWAEQSLTRFTPQEVLPNLNLYLAYNTGAAFSFLSDAGGWQRWFFTTIAIVVSLGLVYWMKTLKQHEKWTAAGLALILSGAIGNLIDRMLFGHVIDFIQFYYRGETCLWGFSYHRLLQNGECIWPSFNIADSAITVGATILIWLSLREMIHERRNARSAESKG